LRIGCYHLVSNIHNQKDIDLSLNPFLKSIEAHLGEEFLNIGPKDIKEKDILPVLLIKSGGVEEKFKRIYQQFPAPYIIMAGCLYNALPAALEIKEYLYKRGEKAVILHGSEKLIARRLNLLKKVIEARKNCRKYRVGVLGKPSDWLIASGADYNAIRKKLGIKIFDIPIEEMIRHIDGIKNNSIYSDVKVIPQGFDEKITEQSLRIYKGLRNLMQEYKFNAITVRCFDLLDFYKNTACLALSILNSEGMIAGCEGDVPTLISMIISYQLTGKPVFMANPACLNIEENSIVFAHCTIPVGMCKSYSWHSHFESGLGIGVRGKVKEGPVTIFKLDGNAERHYLAEGEIIQNLDLPDLCRSQLKIKLKESVTDFLEKSVANHHVICNGRQVEKFEKFFNL